jgi:hypothetical protein
MLRYVLSFLIGFGFCLYLFLPSQDDYDARHARSSAILAAVVSAPVREVEGAKFYYRSYRRDPDLLHWDRRKPAKAAQCIRCPLSLHKIDSRIQSISYVRLANGEQIIVEIRDDTGTTILSRPQVLEIAREIVHSAENDLSDPREHERDRRISVFFAILGGALSTLAYAGMRARDRDSNERRKNR